MLSKTVFLSLILLGYFADAMSLTLKGDIKDLNKMATITGNGSKSIEGYDINHFSYQKEVSDIMNVIRGSECSYKLIVGRDEIINRIPQTRIYGKNSDAAITLSNLAHFGRLYAVVAYYWDRTSGDEQNCSQELIKLYFSNSKVLILKY